MTERTSKEKLKRGLSLAKNKQKGSAKAGTSAAITSFFSTQPPPKLACPLCGQLVPRFKINEHIDLQCLNFERGDSNSTSASCVKYPDVAHKESPELHQNQEEEKVKETGTSPYFKKYNCQQILPEMSSKNVVRMIDLGSFSSKLSRKHHKMPESSEMVDKETKSEKLNSSQKENHLIQSLEEKKARVTETDFTPEAAEEAPSCPDGGRDLKPTSDAVQRPATLNQCSSSSKLTKRRKETASFDSVSKFRKKAKHDGSREEPEEVLSSRPEMNDMKFKTKVPSTNTTTRVPEDVYEKSTTAMNNGSLADAGGENATGGQAAESSHSRRLPYYLRNFQTVLQAVLENEDDSVLFNQEDMSFTRAFKELSVMGQKLYVRLFQRKLKWLQVNKLDYEEISSDLGPVAQELVNGAFLQSENDLQDLGEALDLLPAPEIKALAKTFHLVNSGTQKQQLVEGLRRLSRQKSLFSMSPAQNSIGDVILKRAKQLAGSCVRLSRGPRAVFSRILLLFSLTDTMDEEEMAAGGQSQLFTILLVNSGRLAFPDYTVQRKAKVFQDRDDLIRYDSSMRALLEVTSAMQGGHWEEAMELYTAAKGAWMELRENHDVSHQEELPLFLRSFTTGWAYTRILSRGVEILQRLRRYEEAVEELRSLLSQSVYCPDGRGRWWDRLALNLHQHLKKPEQAICAIRDGLSDPLVRAGHKLSLYQRAGRMAESARFKKYRKELKNLPSVHVQDVKHVTIRGQLFPLEGSMGKSVFVIPAVGERGGSAHATIMGSVEELSLAHYRHQGFDQGIHGEGSTFSTLFALLLWDIIFMEGVPDVFRNQYQTCPLDLHTDCFYRNRKEAIDRRVQLLSEASVEMLHGMLEDVWTSHERKVCSLVDWERFSSLQQAQSLVSCLGGQFLGGVIARMSKDYRHCRAGLPDLVVWSSSKKCYKLVEVKGPTDRLSQKQQVWLDELQKLGADVEVCHVVATGARGACLE
ncbi:fanconi-associated nuclease 1 [Brachionichthys hirsutus]|uniref:fanconi-associated nuclease 1 n=1 Tax=Brachionichthys hirsutus TaxID=412623 RepID=UPI00360481FC